MQSNATTVAQYVAELTEERQVVVSKIRQVLLEHLPKGFKETIGYGMIGYVVPHELYPAGYHCDAKTALPFISLASQKNFIALYHMGMYADKNLLQWFETEYPKHCNTKLDMGKSCIRFKKMNDIPYGLIGALAGKMSVAEWVTLYEENLRQYKKS